MKSEHGYRFTLGFRNDNELNIKVGEFLERLKQKKSRFIIEVVGEYLEAHPELLDESESHEIQFKKRVPPEELDRLREEMRVYIDEKLTNLPLSDVILKDSSQEEIQIDDMLQDLDIFGDM